MKTTIKDFLLENNTDILVESVDVNTVFYPKGKMTAKQIANTILSDYKAYPNEYRTGNVCNIQNILNVLTPQLCQNIVDSMVIGEPDEYEKVTDLIDNFLFNNKFIKELV